MRVLLAFGRLNPGASAWRRLWWIGFCQPIFWVLLRLLWGYRFFHAKRIPAEGGVLMVCNHQSYLDLPVLGAGILHRQFCSMARHTLFRNRIFAALIRSVNAFPVDQEKADVKSLRDAVNMLKAGKLVLVFPEGARSPDGHVQPFQPGLMLLIRRSKCRVVPMAVDGAWDVWPIHQKWPRWHGRVGALCGQAIDADTLCDMPPEQALHLLRQRVDECRLDLRQRLRTASRGRYPADHLADDPSVAPASPHS